MKIREILEALDEANCKAHQLDEMFKDCVEYDEVVITISEAIRAADNLDRAAEIIVEDYDEAFGYPSKGKEYEFMPTSMQDSFTNYEDKHGR